MVSFETDLSYSKDKYLWGEYETKYSKMDQVKFVEDSLQNYLN